MSVTVSVIIPSYNSARFLGTAIQSVRMQTFKDFEIIVVDDGSTDNTRQVLAQFNGEIQYIYQENQGLAGARNTGILQAAGRLVSLLDADDEWYPDYLEKMVALSDQHTDASVFYCVAQCMDVNRQDLPQVIGGPPVEPQNLYHALLRANFIIPSTVTFRRKIIVEAGCFDDSLRSCEDWDLWLRLLPSAKIMGTFQKLARYRVHGSSLSTNLDGMHAAARRVIEKQFGNDEGDPTSWSPLKRRAYGGIYRYECITYVQRQSNWDASLTFMCKALQTDPSLSLDLDLFYELALGVQSVGHRGVSDVNDFEENAAHLQKLVLKAVDSLDNAAIRKQTLGTAFYALSLVSYNSGPRLLCRKYIKQALKYRPGLIVDTTLIGLYLKSFITKETVNKLKHRLGPHS